MALAIGLQNIAANPSTVCIFYREIEATSDLHQRSTIRSI
jgi:hypothetical protein